MFCSRYYICSWFELVDGMKHIMFLVLLLTSKMLFIRCQHPSNFMKKVEVIILNLIRFHQYSYLYVGEYFHIISKMCDSVFIFSFISFILSFNSFFDVLADVCVYNLFYIFFIGHHYVKAMLVLYVFYCFQFAYSLFIYFVINFSAI